MTNSERSDSAQGFSADLKSCQNIILGADFYKIIAIFAPDFYKMDNYEVPAEKHRQGTNILEQG